jgi:hypothetical protein
MAEVMSMLSDENSQGELNADEQESLQIGEEMEQQQETMLAGKYKNAEELEAAYIELQKKLGSNTNTDTPTTEESTEEEETKEDTPSDPSLFDRLWEEASGDKLTEETVKALSESKPEDLAKMYLDYRSANTKPSLTEADTTALKGTVGGDKAYSEMIEWAGSSLPEAEINMYDSVMDSGDPNAAYFAMQALKLKYTDAVGVEGNLLQGKAPASKPKGFKSQAEVVTAMQDPRYDRDPAYRQEVMAKLESSNVNF